MVIICQRLWAFSLVLYYTWYYTDILEKRFNPSEDVLIELLIFQSRGDFFLLTKSSFQLRQDWGCVFGVANRDQAWDKAIKASSQTFGRWNRPGLRWLKYRLLIKKSIILYLQICVLYTSAPLELMLEPIFFLLVNWCEHVWCVRNGRHGAALRFHIYDSSGNFGPHVQWRVRYKSNIFSRYHNTFLYG